MQTQPGVVAVPPYAHPARAAPSCATHQPHPEEPESDAALAVRLAAGENAALAVLYQRHHGAAFAVALTLLRDAGAAEDLVHEAFLRAWRRAGSYRPDRGSLRSWLLAIVRNAAIDQLRQQALQRRPEIAAAQAALHSTVEPDITAQVALSLDVERLHQALAKLAPGQRRAVQQAFLAEVTHREIAQQEGVPLGTVKGRVRLGLQRLRVLLADPPESLAAG
ncbi:MAG: sigma-70 family RNA polymerase sigma factor [Thermomicrobiales bacterium]|nr:sigma-70 family RNA polymerase sigma factor [Thermomicrobiales bacterium]